MQILSETDDDVTKKRLFNALISKAYVILRKRWTEDNCKPLSSGKAAKTTIGTLRRIKQRARANDLRADLLELLALAKTSASTDLENSRDQLNKTKWKRRFYKFGAIILFVFIIAVPLFFILPNIKLDKKKIGMVVVNIIAIDQVITTVVPNLIALLFDCLESRVKKKEKNRWMPREPQK